MFPTQDLSANLTDFEIVRNDLKILQNKEGRDSFQKQLKILRDYLESDESQKENRSIQCGIFFYNQYICVNIGNLKNTLGKCKSTVNNSFQQMGYSSLKSKSSANMILYEAMPSLKNWGNVKKWSVRSKSVPQKANNLSIEISKPLVMPTSKSEECLSIKSNFPVFYPQLSKSPIEHELNYDNNGFFINNFPNDFINDDIINPKFEAFNQPEFPPLFDEISSFF